MNDLFGKFLSTWGERSIAVAYAILIFFFARLPFLEFIAFTPIVVFVQRFSLTLSIGTIEKTVQLIIFLAPFLVYKAIKEYLKRYSFKNLRKEPLIWIVAVLFASDLLFTVFSITPMTSLIQSLVKLVLYGLFISVSIWLKIIWDSLNKPQLLNTTFSVVRTFVITFGIFTIVNSFVSVSQFIDCSFFEKGCSVWSSLDNFFPNRLLPVGHQTFNEESSLIRAPGFFGDVNLNGMVALLTIIILGTLLIMHWFLTSKKGHSEKNVIIFLSISIVTAVISYTLTLSRSALLGFVPLALIILVFFIIPFMRKITWTSPMKNQARILIFGTIAIIGFTLGIASQIQVKNHTYGYSVPLTEEAVYYIQRILSPSDPSATDHSRLFESGIELASKNNFLGFGVGTFKMAYSRFIDPRDLDADPHSTYVTVLVEQGVIGLTITLIFIGYCSFKSFKLLLYSLKYIQTSIATQKTLTKEIYIRVMVITFVAMMGLALPFFSLATITYYGFFLPFIWWFGSVGMISLTMEYKNRDNIS